MHYHIAYGATPDHNNRKKIIAGILMGLAMTVLSAVPAFAAPSEQGQCRQDAHDAFVAASEEGTRGDFMSDTLFGNEPNEENGRTVPSQSPGPFVNTGPNEPPRNDRTRGFSGGDLQAAVKAACQQ